MKYLAVCKFAPHQHYKDRRPPWIKFYVKMLDPHHPLNDLPVATRYLFDRLLLLAAEYDNAIPNDSELIARLLRMPPRACREGLDQLLEGRWIKETRTKRRASKRASKSATPENRDRVRERDRDMSSSNGYVLPEHAVEKLLRSLKDKDPQTRGVVNGLGHRHRLAEGDFAWALECATGPGVVSPTRVAIAELKKRGAAKS